MVSPYYQVIKGNFAIVGKKPDGDSIRFIADEPNLYANLYRFIELNPRATAAYKFDSKVSMRPNCIMAKMRNHWEKTVAIAREGVRVGS